MPAWPVWFSLWYEVGFLILLLLDKENQPTEEKDGLKWWVGWIVLPVTELFSIVLRKIYNTYGGKDK